MKAVRWQILGMGGLGSGKMRAESWERKDERRERREESGKMRAES
jgi:hypothetical protein